MSDNVLETIRTTVQEFHAPEMRTHSVRLDNIDRRIDELRHGLERQIVDSRESLQRQIVDAKELLCAEMRALDARMNVLEALIRGLIQQVSVENWAA